MKGVLIPIRLSSYERIHTIHNRGTPMKMMAYKLALELHNLNNTTLWVDLNMQQNFNKRAEYVQIFDKSNLRVGKTSL